MTRLVLLPRAEDSLDDWHQSEDFFSPNGGQIRANLAPSKRLSVDGIPSPWAARDFMKWRLEDQKSDAGKEAVRIFQTLTLQFLRLIEGREVALVVGADGIGRLAKVLLRPGHDQTKRSQSGSLTFQTCENIASWLVASQAVSFFQPRALMHQIYTRLSSIRLAPSHRDRWLTKTEISRMAILPAP